MQFESPDALKECRILIVEDSKANVDILVRALRKDYTLGVALDGRKALDFAGSAHTRPNLILLDIVMPEMDGFAVCRALKDNPETRDIPIIFITAMDDPGHKAEGFEHGAVDYITKPFEIAEVQARVKTHLALQLAQEELRNQNIILENRVRKRTRELEETRREVIDRLSMAAEYHDLDTGHHIRRISDFVTCWDWLWDSAKTRPRCWPWPGPCTMWARSASPIPSCSSPANSMPKSGQS